MASDNVQSGHFSGVPESSLGGFVAIFKILRKYAAMVIACVILSGGGTLLYSRSMPKVYQASTLIEMNPRANQPLGDSASGTFDIGAGLFWDPTEYYQTQYKLISSGAVLTAAVEKLSLQTDDDFLGYPPESKHDPISAADVAGMLAQRINVDPIKGTRLFFLRASDTDPKRSKRIADAVASVYIDQNLQAAISSSSEAVAWLDGQIDHIKGELEVDENALYAFKQRNNLPSISINDSSNSMRQEMEAFDQALTKTRMLKAELQARKAELGTVSPDNPDAVASSELLSNAYLQSLRGAYLKAAADRSALISQGKGENHPQVKEADARLVDAKKALLTEVANIQDATGRDLAVVEHEERSELALFLDARHAAVDLNMKEIEYHRLDRTREQDEKLYGLLLERMKAADLARMLRANNLRVVETAGIPDTPIRPRISTNVGVGLLAGFLIGFALAWVREQLDSSIKTPDDLEQKLGLVFLGLLPELEGSGKTPARRRAGPSSQTDQVVGLPMELVVHSRPLSSISEAARSIRTNLMFMNPDRPCKTLLVSSAAPSEGKTTVACSMAIALAQGGERVCIVDCDLRRPRLHRIFEREGDAGVTSVLVGDATIDEVAKPTVVTNLWSIPTGPLPPNPADVLQSARFRKFMEDLAQRFDRVVVDSPPLVAVTDSAIISTLVDGTIFVVRAFATGKHVSAQGLRALRDVDAPLIGGVLNAVDLQRSEYTYYTYYNYKREGYSSHSPVKRDDGASEHGAAPPN
jgi:capsular exopolysaccharide synthesis family protein